MTASVRRLAFDVPFLMRYYLLFQIAIGLFLDFAWLSHPFGNPILMPGVLLAINGSMIAPRIPVWRMLPVTARDVDRARWWQCIGAPALLLALLLAAAVAMARAMGRFEASWRDVGLSWGGQFACCVIMALVWMAMPMARRKWGRWSGLIVFPLLLFYFRIVTPAHGDLRPALEATIPIAILAALGLYLTAGHWPLPQTAAIWAAPSGQDFWGKGADTPSRLPGWSVFLRAHLPMTVWLWGGMAFVCLAVKYFLPSFQLGLFVWIYGLVAAQVLVVNLAAGMRVFRALPLSGAGLTVILVLMLICAQGLSLGLFRLVLEIAGDPMPIAAFLGPLIFPLVYFPAVLRFGMRVAQIGYALAIMVLVPFQMMSGGAAPLAGLSMIAALSILWIWREIARGHHAYQVQPLVPARWRGAE